MRLGAVSTKRLARWALVAAFFSLLSALGVGYET
jgi:hypothetical protein